MRNCIAASFLMVTFVGTGSVWGNVLLNPSFETGTLAPWFAESGTPLVTNAEAHTGTYSVSAFSGDEPRQNFPAVSVNDISEVSTWIKRAGGAFNQYTFYYDDSTSQSHVLTGSGNDWMFFDLTSNLSAGKNLNGFSIFGTTSGPAFLDDFTIEAIPEPSTGVLVMLSTVGYLLGRRNRFNPH